MKKLHVGILGATGMVGQQYLQLLSHHPWFEVSFLASSELSAGKCYGKAVEGRWHGNDATLKQFSSILVHHINEIERAKNSCAFVFSAVNNEGAQDYEELYAKNGIPVISNAAYHRQSVDVPVLIPEVNPGHTKIIPIQQKNRGWNKGFIVAKPNCSLQSYMIPLAPLHEQFRVTKLLVTTMQAVSGAGYPGVSSLEMIGNVIPYIAHEEEKSEQEPLKIWGHIEEDQLCPARDLKISSHCNRVPVLDGHLACISVEFAKRPSGEEVLKIWKEFQGLPQQLQLPLAPKVPIIYREEANRPQPREDKDSGNGMAVTIGRLRSCPIFHYRFTALSHNTIRGAAGGGILNAELLLSQRYL